MDHVYRPTTQLPKRVVLDTNIFLNAAFVPGCPADRCVRQLANQHFQIFVDESTFEEAKRVLAAKATQLGLFDYPIYHVENYLRRTRVIYVPPSPHYAFDNVNRHDLAVAGAAKHYQACLLTGDLKLLAECESQGLDARCPSDYLLEKSFQADSRESISDMLSVSPLSKSSGALFARVFMGNWAGSVAAGKFTVIDIENVGRLLFDCGRGGWIFESRLGADVFVAAQPKHDEPWIVLASYSIERQVLQLRAGTASGDSHTSEQKLKSPITSSKPGRISFCQSIDGEDLWNGSFARCSVSAELVGKETWQSVLRIPGLCPDPASGNILDSALKRTVVNAGMLFLPSARQLAGNWL